MHPELGRIAPDEVSNRVQDRERVNYCTSLILTLSLSFKSGVLHPTTSRKNCYVIAFDMRFFAKFLIRWV